MSVDSSVPRSRLWPPMRCVVDNRLLATDATLISLPLHHFEGDASSHLVADVAPLLEQHPDCPGIIVLEQHQLIGLISREHLLEWLLNPTTHLLEQPLSCLVRMARTQPLILPVTTPIQGAAQQLLCQPTIQQPAPVIVQLNANTYRLLNSYDLLRAAWQIRDMEVRLRLERTHIQMIQTEKMASLGRLVNGVAHEILDPVGFIWGNLCHISDYTQDLLKLIDAYEVELQPLSHGLAALREEVELDYLQEDLPKAIASIQSGADRLKTLATSLQTFCYIDEVYPKPADIHHCLDSIIFLLETQLSGEIEVVRNYGYLPPVTCYIGQLNQVFTNILSNAVQVLLKQIAENSSSLESYQSQIPASGYASETAARMFPPPCITITTQVWTQHFDDASLPLAATEQQQVLDAVPSSSPAEARSGASSQHRWVSIQIANNGPRLLPQQYQQIMNAFSNTASSGKETSLAVSYKIVTTKHDGKLLMRSPLPPDALPGVQPASHYASSSVDNDADDWLSNGVISDDESIGTEFQILLPIH